MMAGESDRERLHILPLYVNDLTSDELVEAMTTEEFGAYIHLLIKAWKADPPCTIPDDDEILARWSRMTDRQWKKCRKRVLAPWKLLQDGRLQQKRLVQVRDEVLAKINQKREAGAKGGKARAASKCVAEPKQNPSTATVSLEVRQPSANSESVAEGYQSKSKTNDSSNEESPPLAPPPESEPKQRTRLSRSTGPSGADIVGIEVHGELVLYDDDHLVWEAAFIQWWNSKPGVIRRELKTLDSSMRETLIDRLSTPDWHWKRTAAHFPLWFPSDFKPNLNWFLKETTVSNILGGMYAQRTGATKAGLFGNPREDPTRVRTGETVATAEAAMAAAAAKRLRGDKVDSSPN